MAWSFTADTPVYLQVADRIKKMVLSGEYSTGAQLMTVRQLAMEAAVNPNTVQRAFSELETEGIIVSKGTLGRFVTEDEDAIALCRKKMAERIVCKFIGEMEALSVNREDAIVMIKEAKL